MTDTGIVIFGGVTTTVSCEDNHEEIERQNRLAGRVPASRRILPARRRVPVFDSRRCAFDPSCIVDAYDAWRTSPRLRGVPTHTKLRTAGLETYTADQVVVGIHRDLAKKLKARAKNQRRRHAKQQAKKLAQSQGGAAAPAQSTDQL